MRGHGQLSGLLLHVLDGHFNGSQVKLRARVAVLLRWKIRRVQFIWSHAGKLGKVDSFYASVYYLDGCWVGAGKTFSLLHSKPEQLRVFTASCTRKQELKTSCWHKGRHWTHDNSQWVFVRLGMRKCHQVVEKKKEKKS